MVEAVRRGVGRRVAIMKEENEGMKCMRKGTRKEMKKERTTVRGWGGMEKRKVRVRDQGERKKN